MNRSLSSKIEGANTVLLVSGNVDAIGTYFAADYVAHLTDQVMTGGHVWRDMVTSRFRDGLIAEDWVITDLAERLLLARKR